MTCRSRFALFALWLVLLSAPAGAAPPVDTTLSNGLRVILVPEPKAPVVTVQVWYRVGARDEVTGRTGLSHLMEHMMFKGTSRYGKGEVSRLIASRGGNDTAFTSQDYTAYFENLSSDHLDLALELEADRMANLVISDAEFALERDVVKEERRTWTEDDPHGTLIEHLYAMAYMVHPYHSPVIGWMDDLDRLTADDIRAYYRRHYTPSNATLVIVGAFDPPALLARVQRIFGAVEGGPQPTRLQIAEPPQRGERRVEVKKEAQLPFVFMGFHVPNYRSPDTYALTVLAALLSEGNSSRLYRSLVYEQQIAVAAGGDYSALSADPPLLYVYAMAHPTTNPAELEAGLVREIEQLKTTPPAARELQKAKNQIEAQFVIGQDSNFYRAMQIGTAETVGAGMGYVNDFVANIRKVTAEDVSQVARTYLRRETRTVGTLAPLRSEGPDAASEAPAP